MSKTESAILNLINGNISDAKKDAKNIPFNKLINTMEEGFGFSFPIAIAAAELLKGNRSFQSYCDAKNN
jgi:hypothetical protein